MSVSFSVITTLPRRPPSACRAGYTEIRTAPILVLRWLKENTALFLLARDSGISIATAYRYLHEALDVIAARLPDLPAVLEQGRQAGWESTCAWTVP